jgi:hypothetical protein
MEEIRAKVVIDNKGAQKSIKEVTKSTKELNEEAKGAIGNFQVMGVSINGIKASFSKAIPIAKGLFSTVKAGIASTGIGLLVIAVGSLITYFTKTKKGAEILSVAFKGVGAAISVITDRISSIGGAIIKVFKGDFKGAAEDAKSAVTGLGDEIRKETAAAIELGKAFNGLRDSQRDLRVKTAESKAEIEALKIIAEDITKTDAERTKAAQEAFNKEQALMDERVALAEEALRIKREENALGESMAEDLDEEAELQIELAAIKEESTAKQISLQNFLNGLKEATKAKEKAAADEAIKLAEEEAARKKEIADQEEADRLEREAKKAEEADQLRIRQEEVALLNIENAQERELQQLEFKMQAEMRAVDGFENAEEQKTLIKAKYTKLRNNLTTSEAEFSIANANAAAAVVTSSLSTLAANHVQGTKSWKNLKIAEATISGFQAAVNAFKSTSEIPLVGGALAPIAAATALAAMQQQISQIKSTPIPEQKLARGGIVSGMGTGTSDSVRTRLSKGETVINARSSKMFLPLLSQINSAGGGDDFAASGDTALQSEAGAPVVKAYVLADDMSSNQDRLNKIRRRSTL